MKLALYPRVAPNDRIRVWLGLAQVTEPPPLNWFFDDAPRQPDTLRALSSVRANEMLTPGADPKTVPRTFTGVYEFSGLTPDTLHKIRVEGGPERATLEVRTLPATVTAQLDRSFNVLLVSCFHQAEDRGGLAGTIVSQLKATTKPHLTILAGDQVYLDLPTLQNFHDDLAWLADKFEKDYTLNWLGPLGYEQVLAAAPSVSLPDDHEYWNNFPHVSPFIQNSRKPEGRERWRRAAQAAFEGFQLAYPARVGDPVIIDVAPLSFFLADTRTNKDFDRRFTMNTHQQLDDWVSAVIAQKGFGVFVSGQSLFRDPAGNLGGKVGDYELPNYGDYGRIMLSLQRLVDAGRPVLCLTGDVHWGRVTTARDIRTGRLAFSEIISSPASLVTTIGADQVGRIGAAIGGLFGRSNDWPRHSDADEPPAFLASDALQGRFPCKSIHPQKGNHVVMLKFRQIGGGLELRITYWPLSLNRMIGR
ncbi:MAG TPA: hypothetical protein VE775_01285, partial [Pyrinomonadaceae bacterium]|nr:hypothetical protein [Pyrinomonadaceae bacterium]